MAHSAGGNYAKDAYLRFGKHLEKSGVASGGRANTSMRFVFLASPHHGTDFAITASAGSVLYAAITKNAKENAYDPYGGAVGNRKKFNDMVSSRGFQQLLPGNSILSNLNREFIDAIKASGNVEAISYFGTTDMIVSDEMSMLDETMNMLLKGFGHSDVLKPSKLRAYRNQLLALYSLRKPDQRFIVSRAAFMKNWGKGTYGAMKGASPRFVTGDRTERSVAIQNYLKSHLTIHLAGADLLLAPIADRIDTKIASVKLPQSSKDYWWGRWKGKPTYELYRILDYSRLSHKDPILTYRADRLVDEIIDAIDPLLLYALPQIWGRNRLKKDNPNMPVFPEGFEKRFEKPRYTGPGALLSELLTYPKRVYMAIAKRDLKLKGDDVFPKISEWASLFPKEVFKHRAFLQCSYIPEDGESRGAGRAVYYWYKKAPEGWDKLAMDHPLRKAIGPPRSDAPDRLADAKW